jgi:hypothetical protein
MNTDIVRGNNVRCHITGLIAKVDTVVPSREHSLLGPLPTTLFLSVGFAVFTRRLDEVTKVD